MVEETDTMVSLPVAGDVTYREWHAFVEGVYGGVRDLDDSDSEYDREKHYWRVGWLLGRRWR